MLDAYSLLHAMNGIHEEDVIMAGKIYFNDKRSGHIGMRRIVTFALAAALILALGVTSYAAGWLSPIFSSLGFDTTRPDKDSVSPEFAEVMDEYYAELEDKNAVYDAAEEYMNSAQPAPESIQLPEFHNSTLTLSERYYDGETLLLGINFEQLAPGMVFGFEPDTELMEKLNNVAFFHDVKGNDHLDVLLGEGMQQDIYEDYLNHRSEHAKEYDLRHLSAISLDWLMQGELSAGDYERAWEMLIDNGHICLVESSVFISDHILMDDGTDLGINAQERMEQGIVIEANNLPDNAKGLETLNIQLKVKNVRTYYYMELGGPAYFCTELVDESLVPFSVENAKGK